jgi:hypothetical protein
MNLRTMARVFGAVFLLVGILGFVPGITHHHDDPHVTLKTSEGMLLGLFHVNVLHNLVHILFGVWGLAAGGSLGASRGYFRGVGIIYAALAVLGLISAGNTNRTFGFIPIEGHDVWLHAVLAIAGLYLGFAAKATDVSETRTDGPVV